MKIVTVVGARPQFVKAAALCRAIQRYRLNGASINEVLVHTGQHYDQNMSSNFFQEMEIPYPKYNLGINSQNHGAMTGRMLEAIEKVLIEEKPDWTLIYGDTNSTLAGALASVKLHISVAHVEAGLRSFNRKMPEEINRIVADQCSDILFTPTTNASNQLAKEGISEDKIHQVGDIMYEVSIHYQQRAKGESRILQTLNLSSKEYALATVHRAENTDDHKRLHEIFSGLDALASHYPVVLPIHPRTKQALERQKLLQSLSKNLLLIDPVGYFDMIQLEANAKVILTDSGGVQKEAYFFQVPCVTLREETEWTELVDHGYNRLVAANRDEIVKTALQAIEIRYNWQGFLYGDGKTSDKILQRLTGVQ